MRRIVQLIVILSILLAAPNCSEITICDPTLGDKAGCPNSHPVCDPTGICRNECQLDSDCDSGLVCDTSSSKTAICQTACNANRDCPNLQTLQGSINQICYHYSIAPTTTGGETIDEYMCKGVCPNYASNGNNPPNWCQNQNICIHASKGSTVWVCSGPVK